MEQFIANSVSKKAVNDFYRSAKENDCEIHTLQIWRDGKLELRIAQHPYSCTDVREIYSLSKTFTSTIVGIVVDMGLLSVETNVLDIFPEIQTEHPFFKKLKVKHILSMNTGHENCVMQEMFISEDVVHGFFSVEPKYEPGTHFMYNNGATCLLGSIVERVTGKKFFNFACEKLFYPLGIHNVHWSQCPDGSCVACAGLHISNDDIIKLGLMYQNKGIYNGKRIVSSEWIQEATSFVSDNTGNGTPDWTSGYGYQIWMNAQGGFRGDGAFGQLCMVLPEYNAVVAVQASTLNMQVEIDLIFELLKHLNCTDIEEAQDIYSFAPQPCQTAVSGIDRIYLLDPNPQGFRTLHVSINKEMLTLAFSDGEKVQTITGGNGVWTYSEYTAKHMITKLFPTDTAAQIRSAGCFTIDQEKITLVLRYMMDPNTENFEIAFDGDSIHICMGTDGRCFNEIQQITGKLA